LLLIFLKFNHLTGLHSLSASIILILSISSAYLSWSYISLFISYGIWVGYCWPSSLML